MDDNIKEKSSSQPDDNSVCANSASSVESSFDEPSDADDDEEEVYEVLEKKPSPAPCSQPWEQIGIFFLGAKDDDSVKDLPTEEIKPPIQDTTLFETFSGDLTTKDVEQKKDESEQVTEKCEILEKIAQYCKPELQPEGNNETTEGSFGSSVSESSSLVLQKVLSSVETLPTKSNRPPPKKKGVKRDTKGMFLKQNTSEDPSSIANDSCVGLEVKGECQPQSSAAETETTGCETPNVTRTKPLAKRSGAYQFLNDIRPSLRISFELDEDLECESDSISTHSADLCRARSNSFRESVSNMSDLDIKTVSDAQKTPDVAATPDRNGEVCCTNKKKKEVRLKCTTCGKRCHPSCQNLTRSQAKDVQQGLRTFWCTDCLLDQVVSSSRDRSQSNAPPAACQKSWRNSEEAGLRNSRQSSEIGFVGCRLPLEKAELDERLKRQSDDKEQRYDNVLAYLATIPMPEEFFLYHEVRPYSPTRKIDTETEESNPDTEKDDNTTVSETSEISALETEEKLNLSGKEDPPKAKSITGEVFTKRQTAKRSKPLKKKSVVEKNATSEITLKKEKDEPNLDSCNEVSKLSSGTPTTKDEQTVEEVIPGKQDTDSCGSFEETKFELTKKQIRVNRKRSSISTVSTTSDEVGDVPGPSKPKHDNPKTLKSWHSSESSLPTSSKPKKQSNNRPTKVQQPLKEPTEHFRRNGYYEILSMFTEYKSTLKKPLGKEQTKNFILKLEREIFRFSLRSSHTDNRVLTDRYDAKVRQVCHVLSSDSARLNDSVQGRIKLLTLVEWKDKPGKSSSQVEKQDKGDLFQVSSDQKISKVVKKEVASSNAANPVASLSASAGSHSDESSQSSTSDTLATWKGALKFESFYFDVLAFSLDVKNSDFSFECPPELQMTNLQPMSEFWRMAESFSRKTLLNKQLSILQLKPVQKSTEYSMFTSKLESQQLFGRVRNGSLKNRIFVAPITRHDTKKPLMNGFSIDASLSKSEISLFVFVISINAFGSLQQEYLSSPNDGCMVTSCKFETDSVLAAVACDIDKKQKLENEVELKLPSLEPPPMVSSPRTTEVKQEPLQVGSSYRLSVSSEPDFSFDNYPEIPDDNEEDDVLPPDVVFEPPVCLSPDRVKREKSPDEDPRILPYFSPVDDSRKSCDQFMPLITDDSRMTISVKPEASSPTTKTLGIGIELEKPLEALSSAPFPPKADSVQRTASVKEEPVENLPHVTKDIPVELPPGAILPMDPRNASELYLDSDNIMQSVCFSSLRWETDTYSVTLEKPIVEIEIKEESTEEKDSRVESGFHESAESDSVDSGVSKVESVENDFAESEAYYNDRQDSSYSEENFYNLVQEQSNPVPLRPNFFPPPRGYIVRQAVHVRGNQRFVMTSQRIPVRPLMGQNLPPIPANQFPMQIPHRGINPRTGVRFPVPVTEISSNSIHHGAVARPNMNFFPRPSRPAVINYGSPCFDHGVAPRPLPVFRQPQPRFRPVDVSGHRMPVPPRFNPVIRPVNPVFNPVRPTRPRYPFPVEPSDLTVDHGKRREKSRSKSPIRAQGNIPESQVRNPFQGAPSNNDFEPDDDSFSPLDTKYVRERMSARKKAHDANEEQRSETNGGQNFLNNLENDDVDDNQNADVQTDNPVPLQGNTEEDTFNKNPEVLEPVEEEVVPESMKSKSYKRFQEDYFQESQPITVGYIPGKDNSNDLFDHNIRRYNLKSHQPFNGKNFDRRYQNTPNSKFQLDRSQAYHGNERSYHAGTSERRFQACNNEYGRSKFDKFEANASHTPHQQWNAGRLPNTSFQKKDQSWKELSPQSEDDETDSPYDSVTRRRSSKFKNSGYSLSQSSSSRNSEDRYDDRSCSRERESCSKEKRRKRGFSIESRDSRCSSMSHEDLDFSFNSRQSERKFRKFEMPRADIEESFITAKKKKKTNSHRDLSPKKSSFMPKTHVPVEDSSPDVVSSKMEKPTVAIAENVPSSSKTEIDLEEGECSD